MNIFVSFVHWILGTFGQTAHAIELTNPIGCGDFLCVSKKVTDALYVISLPIVVIMVLWGAFQIVTAGGDEEKFKSGRKTILYAAIGFVIVLLAGSVTDIITGIFS